MDVTGNAGNPPDHAYLRHCRRRLPPGPCGRGDRHGDRRGASGCAIFPGPAGGACDTRVCQGARAVRAAAAVRRTKAPPVLLPSLPASAAPERKAMEAGHGRGRARNEILRESTRFVRTLRRNRSGHHRRIWARTSAGPQKVEGDLFPAGEWPARSRVASSASPFGIGLGPMAVQGLTFGRQDAEVRTRAIRGCARASGACRSFLNRFTAPGIPVTAALELVCPGEGTCGRQPICAEDSRGRLPAGLRLHRQAPPPQAEASRSAAGLTAAAWQRGSRRGWMPPGSLPAGRGVAQLGEAAAAAKRRQAEEPRADHPRIRLTISVVSRLSPLAARMRSSASRISARRLSS